MLGPFAHGYKTVMVDSWDAKVGVRLVEEHGITAMADAVLHRHDPRRGGIERRRHLDAADGITGGAGVPPSLIERADRDRLAGGTLLRGYRGAFDDRLGVRGQPRPPARPTAGLAGNLLRIIDEDGIQLPRGGGGGMAAIGPEQFVSYSDPAFNLEAFTADGWLRTGDIGASTPTAT